MGSRMVTCVPLGGGLSSLRQMVTAPFNNRPRRCPVLVREKPSQRGPLPTGSSPCSTGYGVMVTST